MKIVNQKLAPVFQISLLIALTSFGLSSASWYDFVAQPFKGNLVAETNTNESPQADAHEQSPLSSSSNDDGHDNWLASALKPSTRTTRRARSSPADTTSLLTGKSTSSNSDSSGDGSGNDDAEYQSMCLVQRDPSWRKNPTVYFFTSKRHNPQTYGCTRDIKFRLNISSVDDDSNNNNNDTGGENEILDGDDKSSADIKADLIDSGLYDGSKNTYVLVHGFLASWNSDTWMCRVKDLILNSTEANVFIVDWSGGSKPVLPIDYSSSVANTKYVGQLMAEFVRQLVELTQQNDAERFHLIGHSLGAHISGYIGYSIGSIGRITALDPAGPCFSILPSDTKRQSRLRLASRSGYLDTGARRLSPESAKLVLALHTDTTFFGLSENCGHYDVYVNGGVKQPNCNSLNPADRLVDLLSLNLADTFDFNIACAHSYAHDLLDTVGSQFGSTVLGAHLHDEDGATFEREDRCVPVAYRCSSWDAFKAGECGFCRNNDTRCIFTGIDFDQEEQHLSYEAQIIEDYNSKLGEEEDQSIADQVANYASDDDDQVNGERKIEAPKDTDKDKDKDKDLLSSSDEPGKESLGRHFIRSGSGSPTCLYHYQIVIAFDQNNENKPPSGLHFYLQLPTVAQNQADGITRDLVRLVQVSHLVRTDSPAQSSLGGEYVDYVRDKYQLESSKDLVFYTALITFQSMPADQCNGNDDDSTTANNNKTNGNKWKICHPLEGIKVTRLWAPRKQRLEPIKWVAVNYMSGISEENRAMYSHLFTPSGQEGIKERGEIDSSSRPKISDLSETSSFKPLTNPLSTIVAPIDCLVSNLNMSESGQSKSNIKCNRSWREMRYALKLVSA